MYRNDTAPKTVATRRPCKVGLECATIVYTSQCTVHPYAMGQSRETVYASEPMSVQNSIQPRVAIRDITTTRNEAYNIAQHWYRSQRHCYQSK